MPWAEIGSITKPFWLVNSSDGRDVDSARWGRRPGNPGSRRADRPPMSVDLRFIGTKTWRIRSVAFAEDGYGRNPAIHSVGGPTQSASGYWRADRVGPTFREQVVCRRPSICLKIVPELDRVAEPNVNRWSVAGRTGPKPGRSDRSVLRIDEGAARRTIIRRGSSPYWSGGPGGR